MTSIGGVKPEWYSLMPGNGTMFADLLGCATPFALGMALNLPHRRVVALDTDGGMLFNLGALCTVGKESPPNLTIIVLDNERYEGVVGCPPTHTSGARRSRANRFGSRDSLHGNCQEPSKILSNPRPR